MLIFRRWVYQFIWLVAVCASGSAAIAKDTVAVRVEPQINASNEVMLRIELKNVSAVPLLIFRDELPWNLSSAMLFFVTDLGGAPLAQIYPLIQINWEDVITLNPGASLHGTRILDYGIPSLAKDRKRRDLIVLWTYKPSGMAPAISKIDRVSGHFELNAEVGKTKK